MPIYEYYCRKCGHQLEVLQRIDDPLLRDCPQCHKPSLAKQISAAGFRLAGTGWYETDFKQNNKKNIAGEREESKSQTKKEKKPAEKNTATEKKAQSNASSSTNQSPPTANA